MFKEMYKRRRDATLLVLHALVIFKVDAPLLHKRIIGTRVAFGALGWNAEESLSGMVDVHGLPFSINNIQGRCRIWPHSGVPHRHPRRHPTATAATSLQ